MRLLFKKVWLVILGLVPLVSLYSQEESECRALLLATYQNLANHYTPEVGESIYLQFSTRIKLSADEEWLSTTTQLYANSEKSYLLNDQITVYQDNATSITIIPSRETIHIGDAVPRRQRNQLIEELLPTQSQLISTAAISSCEDLLEGRRKIVLNLAPEIQQEYKIQKLIYHVQVENKELYSMEIQYVPGLTQETMIITFDAVETSTQVTKGPLDKDPLQQVYENSKRLRKQFAAYEVVDTRT